MWITTIEGKLVNLAYVEQFVHQSGSMVAILSGSAGARQVTVRNVADAADGLRVLANAIAANSAHTDMRNG